MYRGLLLGTGPLVDPGFRGQLSIPLHNLTTNDYQFTGGEGLIWVEFTKLSPTPESRRALPVPGPRPSRTRKSAELSQDKLNSDVDWYLRKSAPNLPVRSGIPEATARAEDAARVASIESSRLRRRADIGVVAIFLAILGLTWSLYSLINDVSARLDHGTSVSRTEYDELQKRVADLERARVSPIASPAPTATHRP